jgi:CHAT domain-containing protein
LAKTWVLLRYYVTEDKVGMLLTTPGVSLARSSAIDAKDLTRRILEFRRLLADPKSNLLPAAQSLYQLLIAPVAADLNQAGAKTIMLSLDGALRYLPFGALHDGSRYLVERWNLPMYTSVTKNRLRDPVAPQWNAAGFGVTRKWRNFVALPAVKSELGSIVKAAGAGAFRGEVYLDDAFTAQRFKDTAASVFQLVHVASHFQFSAGGTEANSFLLLGDGQELTLSDIRMNNYRFDNVDLLTLAACDTGLGGGRDANGREIEALA